MASLVISQGPKMCPVSTTFCVTDWMVRPSLEGPVDDMGLAGHSGASIAPCPLGTKEPGCSCSASLKPVPMMPAWHMEASVCG